MKTYCVTFGQSHPLRDGWIEVEAESESSARELAFDILGQKWSFMYAKDTFDDYYFSGGKYGTTIR